MIKNPRSALNLIVHVSLMEPKLPRVPPLKVYIPQGYPDESPSVVDLRAEYGKWIYNLSKCMYFKIINVTDFM